MMKEYLIILLLLMASFSHSAHSQNQTRLHIDSMNLELKKFDNDTNKVNTLNALSRQYFNAAIYDSVLYFSNAALELASELNFNYGIMKANLNIGNVHLRRANFPMAHEYYQNSLKLGEEYGDKLSIFSALNNIGLTYSRQSKHSEALENFLETLKIANEMGDQERIANANANIGLVYFNLSDYSNSMEYFKKGYDIAEQFDNKFIMATTMGNLGLVHFEVSNYKKALECFNEALSINIEIGDHYARGMILSNIGRLQSELGEYQEALESYNKALEIHKEVGAKYGLAIILNNIGEVHDKIFEYHKSFEFYKESISVSEEIGSKAGLIPGLHNMGTWYLNVPDSVLLSAGFNPYHRYELAFQYTDRALSESTEVDNVFGQKKAWETLSEIYGKQGNFEKAYNAFKKFVMLEDSLHGEEVKNEITRKEVQFEYEKKMVTAKAEQEKVVLRQRSYLISGGFAILFLVVLFNRQRLKARKNKALLEKEKEVDKAKSLFFENVSHDFKTPLTLIQIPAEHLLNRIQSPKDKEELGLIIRNAKYLHRLINQLLEINRIDNRLVKPTPMSDNLDGFVKRTIQNFSKRAESKSIQLRYDSPKSDKLQKFDPHIVETIIYNLVSNALDHTPEGGRVDVSLRLENGISGDRMVLRVADTGKGIPAENHKKVFERYFSESSNGNKPAKAAGIGLAIVRELAEVCGGSVSLKSAPGEGAEFIVVLPIYEIDPSEGVPKNEVVFPIVVPKESAINNSVNNESEKPLILVVDDNSDMRKVISDGLKVQYQVIEAINGVEALELAKGHIPDIVVCDIMMPEMDGLTFSNRIKENPATSHIPIILLTAKDQKTDREIGLKSGAIAYLTKPFHEPELQALIANQIQLREKSWEYFEKLNGIPISTVKPKSDKLVSNLRKFIRDNASNENISIEQLCKHVGFSRTQLYRKLKGTTGKSVMEFIKLVRLELAAETLFKSDFSISEVAFQTGFKTHSHFSKSFAETFGMSPTQFLNQGESN